MKRPGGQSAQEVNPPDTIVNLPMPHGLQVRPRISAELNFPCGHESQLTVPTS